MARPNTEEDIDDDIVEDDPEEDRWMGIGSGSKDLLESGGMDEMGNDLILPA